MDKPAASASNLAAGLGASALGALVAVLGGIGVWLWVGACLAAVGAVVSIMAVYQLAKGVDYLVNKSEVDVDA